MKIRRPLQAAVPVLLALLAAAGSHYLFRHRGVRTLDLAAYLAAGPVSAERTRALERAWIDEALPRRYLPAPVEVLPCPIGIPGTQSSVRIAEALAEAAEGSLDDAVAVLEELHRTHSSSWVPGLALGGLLARAGRLSEADTVLRQLLDRRPVQLLIQAALSAARGGRQWSGPGVEEVLGAIHLLHASGFVRIASRRGGPELWAILRNPIGGAKLLSLRGETDRVLGSPTWAEHRLRAPGCEPSADDLTTLDLYNNLIVGYLQSDGLRESAERRRRELARDYDHPPGDNPLLAVLRRAEAEPGSTEESWLWAVSNAERLLTERRHSGLGDLENPRLALNLAELIESAMARSPPEAREALLRRQRSLLAIAFAGRGAVTSRQAVDFDRGLARLRLLTSVREGTPPALAPEVLAHLDDRQRTVAEDVAFSHYGRRQPETWLRLATDGGGEAWDGLEDRSPVWLAASRQDFAASFARRADSGSREQRLRWIWRAKRVLDWGDAEPSELGQARAALGAWSVLARLSVLSGPAAVLFFAVIIGALVWAVSAWIAIQLRLRRDLFTSFYRREARGQLRGRR